MRTLDLVIIAAYLVGTTLFGCSFLFRRKRGDGAGDFMTGGGRLPTWAIALSVFATHVSSISFLALPEGAYGPENWRGWVNSITVPIATLVAVVWFIPFYRKSTDVSAYSFLERRYGTWARVYASVCFLVMQSARSGVILLLLAILVNQLLGLSCETVILVTGVATMLYAMTGGFAAVVWADAVQSLVLIGGTLVCVACLLFGTPDLAANWKSAYAAGKMSLGSFSLADWGTNTFWVLFFYSICINLQNFGVDQCYTQRYVAAKSAKAAARSILASACLYVPVTLLFTVIGTLLWMYNRANPGVIPDGIRAAAVFPWFIVHKLPTGVSGLLVAAIAAAAMSTVAATLNSGSTVLLEDYWKRFCPHRANERSNLLFLRLMTVALAVVSIGIALAVIWSTTDMTILSAWWTIQGVFSGGMLGLFLLGAFARRTRAAQALVATACGFAALLWVTFGQRALPLPWTFHVNLSIVFGTTAIVVVGFVLGQLSRFGNAKPWIAALVLLSLSSIARSAAAAPAGTLAPLKANFVRVLRQGEPDEDGMPSGVSTQCVKSLVRSQREDGTWPDVDYQTVSRSQWPLGGEHLGHLADLARAPRTPETEAAFHKALGYWLKGDFKNPNWWWNEIGVPQRLGAAGLLMDECLTPAERAGIVRILSRSQIRMTGQNRVWLSECVLMRALLEDDPEAVRAARDAIVSEISMSKTVEGIQSDWSYHQHGNQPQFGNYGGAYVMTLPRLVAVFAGTEWSAGEEQYEILEKLIDRGFRPTVWRGAMDVGSIGRQLIENAARVKGVAPLVGARWLALSGRPEAERIYRDCLADRSGRPAAVPHLGLTWFPKSAMGMYRTANWMIAVKCQTKSVKGTELVNEDNLLGAHLADGALFTYVTGDEYKDVFPFWNWRHVPGITSYDVKDVNWKSSNLSDVAEKTSGSSVRFVLDRDGLHAETSWTFSESGVTAFVSGIASSTGRPVVTTVEQSIAQPDARWQREGDVLVAVNGAIRYELPTNAVVSVTTRHGSWKRHMGAKSGADLVGRVFEITIPHGISPSGASCRWKVLCERR